MKDVVSFLDRIVLLTMRRYSLVKETNVSKTAGSKMKQFVWLVARTAATWAVGSRIN